MVKLFFIDLVKCKPYNLLCLLKLKSWNFCSKWWCTKLDILITLDRYIFSGGKPIKLKICDSIPDASDSL